jgi:hypothetical protein
METPPTYWLANDGTYYPTSRRPGSSSRPDSRIITTTGIPSGYWLASDGACYPDSSKPTSSRKPASTITSKKETTPRYWLANDGVYYPISSRPGSSSQPDSRIITTTGIPSGYWLASDGACYPDSSKPASSSRPASTSSILDQSSPCSSPTAPQREQSLPTVLEGQSQSRDYIQTDNLPSDPRLHTAEQMAYTCGWVKGVQSERHLIDRGFLGSGAHGDVRKVGIPGAKNVMALKKFYVRGELRRNEVEKEIRVLKKLHHPHIVKLIDTYEKKLGTSYHGIFMLMAPVGDQNLEQWLGIAAASTDSETISTHDSLIRKWFRCLAAGLAYMHDNKVHH